MYNGRYAQGCQSSSTCQQNSQPKSSPPPSLDSRNRSGTSTPRLPNSEPCCPVAPLNPPPGWNALPGSTRFPLPHGEGWQSHKGSDGPRSEANLSPQRQP